jgi:hypothetical protein
MVASNARVETLDCMTGQSGMLPRLMSPVIRPDPFLLFGLIPSCYSPVPSCFASGAFFAAIATGSLAFRRFRAL